MGVIFGRPLLSLYWLAVSVGGEELKWHQPAQHKQRSQQGPHFSPHSTAKTYDKSTFLRKNGLSGISDIVIASVHSVKTV